jgi:GNAT superfamily N-acetyltransferase
MAEMVDPYYGLVSFQQAFGAGEVETELGRLHPDLLVHMDQPNGVTRLTYALLEHSVVKAFVVFVLAAPIDGVTCYGVGYAVDERFRKQGVATSTLEKAIDELREGMRPHLPEFYLEAIVGQINVPSQRVAAKILSPTPRSGKDKLSGKPALIYTRRIQTQ